jgi:hypothetical protein
VGMFSEMKEMEEEMERRLQLDFKYFIPSFEIPFHFISSFKF